jgi:signal transduction histidine kinase
MSGICLDITLRRQAEERLNLLADIAGTLLVADSPQSAINDLCTKTLAVLDCQLFFNFLTERETGRLRLNACSGITSEEKERLEWLDYGTAVCGCVARDACRIVVEDIPASSDPRVELVKSLGVQAYACHPLMMGEEVLGTLSFGSRSRATFSNDDLSLMKAVTNLVSIAMERELSREKLQKAHDALELQVAERTKDLVRSLDSLQVEMAERLKAEEELRTRERLLIQQSRLAAMGEMISNIAHQWRQPLNTLGLIVQRLPHFYDAGKFDRDFLVTNTKEAMNHIRHMSATIDDFRDFFRPDRERIIFNINNAVNQAISLIETGFKAQNIELQTLIEGDPTVDGYPSRFAQVILNILFNSRDALLERGKDKGLIRIESRREGERVVLTIRDNAGGIPDDILDKVFDPYFTTKGPDRGTGIGLFMAKSIIENSMGGSITARNCDEGAEFRIEV